MSAKSILAQPRSLNNTQNTNNQIWQYDPHGWPLNPTTGQPYTHKEIVTSGGQTPRPQDVDHNSPYWRYRSLDEFEVSQTNAAKRRRQRQSRRSSRRKTFNAVSVLSSFETQEIDRAAALAERVKQYNARNDEPIPFYRIGATEPVMLERGW